MNSILFFLYHALLRLGLFCLRLGHQYLPPKMQNYIKEREYPQFIWRKNPLPHQRRIWFHAASGEVEYIKPLLKLWKSTYPDDLLFLTYFSTSALDLIPRIPEIDGWAPLPVDLPKPCQNFVKTLHPHCLIISRTDLWPTLLRTLGHTPKILVASTWSEGSKKTQNLGRWMSQWCLPYLNKICVVNENDRQWIQKNLPHPPAVVVTGDPRFDQVQARLQQKRTLPAHLTEWTSAANSSQTFIAGSTWPEDETVLFEALSNIKREANATNALNVSNALNATNAVNKSNVKLSNVRWIIVPHENTSEHLQTIKEKLQHLHLPFLLWSECSQSPLPPSVSILIFDEKGWLAELYQLADMALIGGSFKRQVHSVMEALGCGVPVLVGPYYKNNREAIEFATLKYQALSFVTVIDKDSSALAHYLNFYFNLDPTLLSEVKEKIKLSFNQHCGGTAKTFEEIQLGLVKQ